MRPPRYRRTDRSRTRTRRLAGVAYLLVPALLVWLSLAVYDKDFTETATVTVETDDVGNEMHPHADVKLRGVVVGEVRSIDTDGDGARLTLAMQPDKMARIPANVEARMLPTTLFGMRYVALVPPEQPSAHTLASGGVVPQDRSRNAVELEQAFDHLQPLLTAVQPEKLSATLTAVATALDGRGEKLGDTMVTLDAYLKKLNPELPTLNRDIKELAKASQLYADAAPELTDALRDATVTSATLAEQRATLGSLYASVTSASRDTTTFLRQERANLIRLTAASRSTLETLAEHSASFPCTLRTLERFVPAMDRALGKGTDEPGLHVDVRNVPSRGAYEPGRDTPVYGSGDGGSGSGCYPVPYAGRGGTGGGGGGGGSGGGGSARTASAGVLSTVQGGLGVPNSPQENALVNEVLAAAGGEGDTGSTGDTGDTGDTRTERVGAGALPDWSSLLAGPVLRGTEVRLK
ncbi:MCE family protein [Streptomyces daliensis]